MYKLYRKCKPTEENKYGLEVIENGNPFKQPTFLSLLALNMKLRDTNGSISRILELAGLRTPNGEENIPLENVPISFLGLSYSELSPNGDFKKIASNDNFEKIDEETINFVKMYILPLISNNVQKKGIVECCKNMRNINIMCFCDAIFMVGAMNNILIKEMQKIGFNEPEISTILSQVCIIPIGAEYSSINGWIKDLKFTTIFLLDIFDSFGIKDVETKAQIFGDNKEVCLLTSSAMDLNEYDVCKNSRMLLVDDDGTHDLKSFIHKGVAFSSIIVRLINAMLNNSVRNNYNPNDFVPIDVIVGKTLEKIIEYYDKESKDLSKEELITSTLQDISYPLNGEIDLEFLDRKIQK